MSINTISTEVVDKHLESLKINLKDITHTMSELKKIGYDIDISYKKGSKLTISLDGNPYLTTYLG